MQAERKPTANSRQPLENNDMIQKKQSIRTAFNYGIVLFSSSRISRVFIIFPHCLQCQSQSLFFAFLWSSSRAFPQTGHGAPLPFHSFFRKARTSFRECILKSLSVNFSMIFTCMTGGQYPSCYAP